MKAGKLAMAMAIALAVMVGVGAGCAKQPEEQYTGPKEGLSCKEAYKEVVNQNLCNVNTAEG